MKRVLTLAIVAAVLGGCAIVPLGPRYYNYDGYSRGNGGQRGDSYYRNDGNRYYGREYGYGNGRR